MPQALNEQGAALMQAAIDVMEAALRQHPAGLTATEAGRLTGLYLEVPAQRGYIAWTILQHLLHEKRVIKDGRRYRLP